ncbi:MAG: stage III sporulation protein AA [Chloroflexota bacterium]
METWEQRTLQAIRRDILPFLPDPVRRVLAALPVAALAALEEVRLRQDRPLVLVLHDRDMVTGCVVTGDDMQRALQMMSQSSVYALEEELRQGYLTLTGGHRVGLVGRAVVEHGRIRTIKNISGLNVRVSRELPGVADGVLPALIAPAAGSGDILSALVVGPPRAGKTTLLRDICRRLADGAREWGLPGLKVGLVDERSEIAGCYQGVPQRDVGLRTDVLDACPKAEGIMILIRGMSPDVVVTDELGRDEDAAAVEEAANAGVAVIASAHGRGADDLARRPSLRQLVATGVFHRLVFLDRSRGPGTIAGITDERGTPLACAPRTCTARDSEVISGVASQTAR